MNEDELGLADLVQHAEHNGCSAVVNEVIERQTANSRGNLENKDQLTKLRCDIYTDYYDVLDKVI